MWTTDIKFSVQLCVEYVYNYHPILDASIQLFITMLSFVLANKQKFVIFYMRVVLTRRLLEYRYKILYSISRVLRNAFCYPCNTSYLLLF